MTYIDYKVSRDLVWEILLQEGVCELPIRVGDLCKSMDIGIKEYDLPGLGDGYSTIIGGKPFIFINSKNILPRKRFTAAHELGHVFLGHVGKYKLVNREPSANDSPIETAANVFAARLLAPACVLWGLNVKTADDITKLCDISHKAAGFRMERMDILYERNKFLTSRLERRVFEQFKDYIDKNRL